MRERALGTARGMVVRHQEEPDRHRHVWQLSLDPSSLTDGAEVQVTEI